MTIMPLSAIINSLLIGNNYGFILGHFYFGGLGHYHFGGTGNLDRKICGVASITNESFLSNFFLFVFFVFPPSRGGN
jgi:hypothetical protein